MNFGRLMSKKPDAVLMPTVFHITHYKAGSQWIYAILKEISNERIITPEIGANHVTNQPVISGKIYPCVYLTRNDFEKSDPPENHRKFIVFRDLRDTLVSQYFSFLKSHEMMTSKMQNLRDRFANTSMSAGLLHIINGKWMPEEIQRSWLDADDLKVCFEDIISDEFTNLKKILAYCEIPVKDSHLAEILEKYSFTLLSGRKRGEEDISSHYRKGISGDWKNYFDDQVTQAFKERFGDLLISTGYEKDDKW